MRFVTTYNMLKWTNWIKGFSEAIEDFNKKHHHYPNILEANNYTFSKIDKIINKNQKDKKKLKLVVTIHEREEEFDNAGSNLSKQQSISFDYSINESMYNNEVRLVSKDLHKDIDYKKEFEDPFGIWENTGFEEETPF